MLVAKTIIAKTNFFFQFLNFTEKFLDFNHCKKYFEITALYSAQAVVRPRANVFFVVWMRLLAFEILYETLSRSMVQ